jgi:hypothetical protein
MGNTMGIDMGNSFEVLFRAFEGNVCKTNRFGYSSDAVRKTGLEGPNKHVATLPHVWFEPQERLQVDRAF